MARRPWTEADYDAAGKIKIQLRLNKTAAQILIDEADRRGISRQALIEGLLGGLVAKAEQPLLKPSDLVDPPKTTKKTKKVKK